nr:C40 family peptidase [Corynebacterium mendelii]
MNPQDYSIEGLQSQNVDGLKALQAAFTKLGAPYVWGATGPDEFDCSGLVVWSYLQTGKRLPRTSQAQMRAGTPVEKKDLQPGDVIGFYPGATHVGLYAGNGMVIHASDYGIPLQVVPLGSMPYYGARRY